MTVASFQRGSGWSLEVPFETKLGSAPVEVFKMLDRHQSVTLHLPLFWAGAFLHVVWDFLVVWMQAAGTAFECIWFNCKTLIHLKPCLDLPRIRMIQIDIGVPANGSWRMLSTIGICQRLSLAAPKLPKKCWSCQSKPRASEGREVLGLQRVLPNVAFWSG